METSESLHRSSDGKSLRDNSESVNDIIPHDDSSIETRSSTKSKTPIGDNSDGESTSSSNVSTFGDMSVSFDNESLVSDENSKVSFDPSSDDDDNF